MLDNATVAYAASTYRVIVLSACLGPNNATVSTFVMDAAARIKAANPAVKVLQVRRCGWEQRTWRRDEHCGVVANVTPTLSVPCAAVF